MTKRLYLLRHAQAASEMEIDDKSRSLTLHGLSQAAQVGAYFKENNITLDQALCSSARRTKMTLAEVKKSGATVKKERTLDEIYNAPAGDILHAIQGADGDNILVVAHNPGIHQLANMLVGRGERVNLERLMMGYNPATLCVFDCSCDVWANILPQENELLDLIQQG